GEGRLDRGAVLLAGADVAPLLGDKALDPPRGDLEQRPGGRIALAGDKGEELLGSLSAAHRPQQGARAAGHDHRVPHGGNIRARRSDPRATASTRRTGPVKAKSAKDTK